MPIWLDISQIEKTADWTAEDAKNIDGGNMVVIRDHDGDFVPFQIVEADFSAHGTMIRQARCNHLFYELGDGPIRNYNLINAIPITAIAAALDGTRWELGNVDDSLISLIKDFHAVYLNPLEMLRLIEHTYEARLKFRVTMGDAGITGYYVDLLEIDNEFRGQRFEFGHNLQGIDLRVDDSRIKTALVGIGMGDEIDLETGEPLPLTFKGVEWSVANGDPCDKPLGQDWVGDEHARLQYGIYDPVSGEKLHRFGKYESQAETPEGLLWATWQQLQKYHVKPQVNVEAQVTDLEQSKVVDIETGELTQLSHEKIRLGNVCYVKAEHKGLIAAVDAKIYRLERYLKKEEAGQTRLLLGDPILLGSDYIWGLEGKVDWKDKRRRKLDRGRGGQTVTVASEDSSLVPWYAKVVVKSGETVNDVWDEIMALLPNGGGQVLFLDGTYTFNGTLEITKNKVHISGQGESTIFSLADNVNSTVRGFMAVNKSGVKITDLAMNGNKENQTISSSNAVTFQYCKNFEIKSIIAKNFLASGILLWTCIDGIIETCQSTGNNNGINITRQQAPDEGCSNILIKGNICSENESNGIRVNEGSDIVIEGNDCTRGWYGIVLINSSNNIIAVNNFQKCRLRGIELDSGSCENIITGNKVKMEPADTGVGIELRMGSNRNTVYGNQCIGLRYEGISIYESDGNSISNNICTDCRTGIRVLGRYFSGPPEELTEALENEVIGNVCNYNRGLDDDYGGGIVVQWARKTQVQNNKCYHNNPRGIFIYSSHDTFVTNNDLFNNALANLVDSGTNTETNPGNKIW